MNLNVLSGLLLTIVVLGVIVFVAKELVGGSRSSRRTAAQHFSRAKQRLSGGEAKPANEHLIGAVGTVISHTSDSARPMRVRLGTEIWSARPASTAEGTLVVGSPVEVVAVDGAVLTIVAGEDRADRRDGSEDD